jgi:hypothetical protein
LCSPLLLAREFVVSPAVMRTTLMAALLSCLACTTNTTPEQQVAEQQVAEQQVREPVPKGERTTLSAYFDIGDQLAADGVEGLGLLGEAIVKSTTLERTDPNIARMHAAVERLSSTDLEAARAAYRDISHALLDYLDAHPDQREGLHLMYCPMTFDDQGAYWVARTTAIRNPYEGSRMLECGALLDWDEGVEHRKKWAAAAAATSTGTPPRPSGQ